MQNDLQSLRQSTCALPSPSAPERILESDLGATLRTMSRVVAVSQYTLDGRFVWANDKFLCLFDYSLEEITGATHRSLCDARLAGAPEYKALWERIRFGGEETAEQLRTKRSGEEFWVRSSYCAVASETGAMDTILEMAVDISESRKRLAELDAKLEAFSREQAIIEFSLDGVVLDANANFLETMGYRIEEIQGKHHRMFCDAATSSSGEYVRFWQRLAKGESQAGEYKRIGANGREVWLQATYTPVLGADGKPAKVAKLAFNVTEQKVQSAVQESKVKALERSQAVIEFDVDGTIRRANENFLSVVGYRAEDVKGRHHRMFCDGAYVGQPAYREFWEKLGRGEFVSGRFKRIGQGGKTVWLHATYNPVFDDQGRVASVVKFASDITAQVEIEETVRQVAQEFSQNASNIAEKSGAVAKGALALGATTEEMNATIEELTASIKSIATNVKSADTLAQTSRGEADAGAQLIRRTVSAMELIQKSSEDISEFVQVISEIASQTNLLAFNAAIEAARAGEHGLGFSVVADEVRKLAERSAQATREISKLIKESAKRIDAGSATSVHAGEAFERILASLGQTTKVVSEITLAADEQLQAAEEVSIAIQQVADETERSAAASGSIATATRDLNEGAVKLRDLVVERS
jgi:methyl-accepting chemotaxis protein